jgi:hypothetical protein
MRPGLGLVLVSALGASANANAGSKLGTDGRVSGVAYGESIYLYPGAGEIESASEMYTAGSYDEFTFSPTQIVGEGEGDDKFGSTTSKLFLEYYMRRWCFALAREFTHQLTLYTEILGGIRATTTTGGSVNNNTNYNLNGSWALRNNTIMYEIAKLKQIGKGSKAYESLIASSLFASSDSMQSDGARQLVVDLIYGKMYAEAFWLTTEPLAVWIADCQNYYVAVMTVASKCIFYDPVLFPFEYGFNALLTLKLECHRSSCRNRGENINSGVMQAFDASVCILGAVQSIWPTVRARLQVFTTFNFNIIKVSKEDQKSAYLKIAATFTGKSVEDTAQNNAALQTIRNMYEGWDHITHNYCGTQTVQVYAAVLWCGSQPQEISYTGVEQQTFSRVVYPLWDGQLTLYDYKENSFLGLAGCPNSVCATFSTQCFQYMWEIMVDCALDAVDYPWRQLSKLVVNSLVTRKKSNQIVPVVWSVSLFRVQKLDYSAFSYALYTEMAAQGVPTDDLQYLVIVTSAMHYGTDRSVYGESPLTQINLVSEVARGFFQPSIVSRTLSLQNAEFAEFALTLGGGNPALGSTGRSSFINVFGISSTSLGYAQTGGMPTPAGVTTASPYLLGSASFFYASRLASHGNSRRLSHHEHGLESSVPELFSQLGFLVLQGLYDANLEYVFVDLVEYGGGIGKPVTETVLTSFKKSSVDLLGRFTFTATNLPGNGPQLFQDAIGTEHNQPWASHFDHNSDLSRPVTGPVGNVTKAFNVTGFETSGGWKETSLENLSRKALHQARKINDEVLANNITDLDKYKATRVGFALDVIYDNTVSAAMKFLVVQGASQLKVLKTQGMADGIVDLLTDHLCQPCDYYSDFLNLYDESKRQCNCEAFTLLHVLKALENAVMLLEEAYKSVDGDLGTHEEHFSLYGVFLLSGDVSLKCNNLDEIKIPSLDWSGGLNSITEQYRELDAAKRGKSTEREYYKKNRPI